MVMFCDRPDEFPIKLFKSRIVDILNNFLGKVRTFKANLAG